MCMLEIINGDKRVIFDFIFFSNMSATLKEKKKKTTHTPE